MLFHFSKNSSLWDYRKHPSSMKRSPMSSSPIFQLLTSSVTQKQIININKIPSTCTADLCDRGVYPGPGIAFTGTSSLFLCLLWPCHFWEQGGKITRAWLYLWHCAYLNKCYSVPIHYIQLIIYFIKVLPGCLAFPWWSASFASPLVNISWEYCFQHAFSYDAFSYYS